MVVVAAAVGSAGICGDCICGDVSRGGGGGGGGGGRHSVGSDDSGGGGGGGGGGSSGLLKHDVQYMFNYNRLVLLFGSEGVWIYAGYQYSIFNVLNKYDN